MKFALIFLCGLILHGSGGFQIDPEGEGRLAGQIKLQGRLHEQEEAPLPGGVTAAATSSARPEAGVVRQGGMPESTDEEHDAALAFLLEHLPPVDAQLPRSFLERNVALALQARHAQPWARAVPWDVFLNEVGVLCGGRWGSGGRWGVHASVWALMDQGGVRRGEAGRCVGGWGGAG